MNDSALIVGLGNPGTEYSKTRHNIGFRILEAFAQKRGVEFQKKRDLKGEIAKVEVGQKKVTLLKPTTYMNLSGEAVRKCLDFYKIGSEALFVVLDDADLPLGQLRLRSQGSSGGHNGLKSIEDHIGSKSYYRLKVGIGRGVGVGLADHVLESFSSEEEEKLTTIIDAASTIVAAFIEKGFQGALEQLALIRPSNAMKEFN